VPPSLATVLLASLPLGAAEPPSLALERCQPARATEPVLCGRLMVPEDRSAPDGRRIPLNLVVLRALGPERLEPLFELAGGPGVPSSLAAGLYTTELRAYRKRRDVVLVDQRGTGGSNALACPAEEGGPLARALRAMYPPSYVRRCRADLEKRADLRFYTTTIAARDLDDVRAALGYDRIHLLGISYGTRLALEYARRFPGRVKSMFLYGVLPPWEAVPRHHAAAGQRALDLLFDECAAAAGCAARYPDLRQEFRDLLARLRRQPARISRDGETVPLTAGVFAEWVRTRLYAPASSRGLPRVIHAAAGGDWEPFLQQAIGEGFPAADGAYLSVTCAEDVPRIDPARDRRDSAGTYLGDYRVRQQVAACAQWPRGDVPADFHDELRARVPVLIYTGYRDPVTPPSWSYAVAEALHDATVVPIGDGAHMPDGLTHMECWDAMALRFLDEGRLAREDLACVREMKAPPFE
jgi:pimeloyl-ACP methyl ester carboxylesterase